MFSSPVKLLLQCKVALELGLNLIVLFAGDVVPIAASVVGNKFT
jgi:hypothetical protein